MAMRVTAGQPRAVLLAVATVMSTLTLSTAWADTWHAAGEVTATSATVWARCDAAGEWSVYYARGNDEPRTRASAVAAEHDFTGRIALAELQPDTVYRYEVWCGTNREKNPATGQFRTAP